MNKDLEVLLFQGVKPFGITLGPRSKIFFKPCLKASKNVSLFPNALQVNNLYMYLFIYKLGYSFFACQ